LHCGLVHKLWVYGQIEDFMDRPDYKVIEYVIKKDTNVLLDYLKVIIRK